MLHDILLYMYIIVIIIIIIYIYIYIYAKRSPAGGRKQFGDVRTPFLLALNCIPF